MKTFFTESETDVIFDLARALTGSSPSFRAEVLLHNILRRMREVSVSTLDAYLSLVDSSDAEYEVLMSLLTIHTTSWFREPAHFQELEECLKHAAKTRPFVRILSAGCSTGQEVYSIACLCEEIRRSHESFEYQIVGCDIDPVSLNYAQQGAYPATQILSQVPPKYLSFFHELSLEGEKHFTAIDFIKQRVSFRKENLALKKLPFPDKTFFSIFCRNVFIYFEEDTTLSILSEFRRTIEKDGTIFIGSNEISEKTSRILEEKEHTAPLSKTSVDQNTKPPGQVSSSERARIAVVDDDPDVLEILCDILTDAGYETLPFCEPVHALERLTTEKFDLMLVDFNMPRMNGLTLVSKLKEQRATLPPCLMVSGHAFQDGNAQEAKKIGILAIIEKPFEPTQLLASIDAALGPQFRQRRGASPSISQRQENLSELILLGASTGGPAALERALAGIGEFDCPPVVVIQHIAPSFMEGFCQHLAAASCLQLAEGTHLEPLRRRTLYSPRGDHHFVLRREGGAILCSHSKEEARGGSRPSVDVLFSSAAKLKGVDIFAGLFTGMGRDGAAGLLQLKEHGAWTFAQDEKSCAVYGMPKEAVRLRAACDVGPPDAFLAHLRARLNRAA